MGKAEDFQRQHSKPPYNPTEERDKKVKYLADHMPRATAWVQDRLNSDTYNGDIVWIKYNEEKRVGLIIYAWYYFAFNESGPIIVLLEDGTILKIDKWGTDGTYESPHSSELLEVAYNAHTMAEARRIELAYDAVSYFVNRDPGYMNPAQPPRKSWWQRIFG